VEQGRRGGWGAVVDGGGPVARLVPLPHEGAGGADRLARLERQGLIRRGLGRRDARARPRKPTRLPGGGLRGLLGERERGWGGSGGPAGRGRVVSLRGAQRLPRGAV